MRLIEVIDKVNDYYVGKQELIWKENKIFFNKKLLFEGDIVLMYSNENLIVLQTGNSGAIVIDKQTDRQYKIDKSGPIISSDLLLLGKWNEDYTTRLLYSWNFRTNTKVWESESYFGNPYSMDGYLFGSLKSKLFRINPDTGESIWQLDLSEKYDSYSINGEDIPVDVQGYIGLHNECLYIKVGNKLIVGVNINSGEEKFHYEYTGENVLLDNLHLDHEKGVIFSIGSTEYFELNLSVQVGEVQSVKEEVEENNIETKRLGSWENNRIYFWEGGANAKFGIFDRVTKQIKFVQRLNVAAYPAIKDVKHGQGKIYVLDGNNTLHVFDESSCFV